jgi:hypothetical protein
MDCLEQVITVEEVVMLFYVSHMRVRRAVQDGRIRARRSAGTWLLLYSDCVVQFGQPILEMS